MLSGHGKMDRRERKLVISSAFLTSSSPSAVQSKSHPSSSSVCSSSSFTSIQNSNQKCSRIKSSSRSSNKKSSFLSSKMSNLERKKSYISEGTSMVNEQNKENYDDQFKCLSKLERSSEEEGESTSDFGGNWNKFSFSSSAPTTAIFATATLPTIHHHRSRIKNQGGIPQEPKENKTGLEWSTTTRNNKNISREQNRRGTKYSSKNKPSFTPFSTFSFPSTTQTPSTISETSLQPPSSSSPSRFLLTFLSSCHLVQVTSRLVVALAMTSLLLILVHVMPGAYCSSSSSSTASLLYSSPLSLSSSSSSVRTTSSTGAAATKRAYFNQTLLQQQSQQQLHHHLKLFETFQPLSSSTSSFTAGVRGGESGGGESNAYQHKQQSWLKTNRWPLGLKLRENKGKASDDDDGGVVDVVQIGKLNNKSYSNLNSNNNNDYANDNHQHRKEKQNNIIANRIRSNGVGGTNNELMVMDFSSSSSSSTSAKLDLNNNKVISNNNNNNAATNSNNNYDYYNGNTNNGNNNNLNNNNYNDNYDNIANTNSNNVNNLNNRSNYNYNYDDSSSSPASKKLEGQSQSEIIESSSSLRNNNNNLKNKSENTNTKQNTQQQEEDDFLMDNEIIETTKAGATQAEQQMRLLQQKASTLKIEVGITSANNIGGGGMNGASGNGQRGIINNGTTKAERDTVVNVSSTGVRPTMAFTNSYSSGLRRSSPKQEREKIQDGDGGEEFGVEEEIYTNVGGTHDDHEYGGGEVQMMQSDQNEGKDLLRGDGTGSNGDRGGEDVYYYNDQQQQQHHHEPVPFSPSASSNSRKLSPRISSDPTAITRTTSTISESSPSSSSSGKQLLLFQKTTAAGGGDDDSDYSSVNNKGAPYASSSSSFFSSPTTSQLVKLLQSSSSSLALANGERLHYPNEKKELQQQHHESENDLGLAVLPSLSSSSSSFPTSTLSDNHHFHPHHHHSSAHNFNQQVHQSHNKHHYKKKDFSGNEVVNFAKENFEEEQVLLNEKEEMDDEANDDEDEDEEEEDDVDAAMVEITHKNNHHHHQQHFLSLKNSLGSNLLVNNSPSSSSLPALSSSSSSSTLSLKKSLINYFKPAQKQERSARKHFDQELYLKNGEGMTMSQRPTVAFMSSSSTLKTNLKKHISNNNEDERMAGDDPSVTNSKPKASGAAASTTASTFSKQQQQRSALQIRRDLSRLIAKGGRVAALTSNGGSLVGPDEDPVPNRCDRLFTDDGSKNGTFESPTMISEEGHLYQCIFMFVANKMERVEVTFTQFNVRGTPPECVHEWVDIWTEVEGTDPTDLVTTPFSGRYCGKIPPRRRISLYGGIAIGFYSDKNSTDETIFRGTFSFINESIYQIGTPVPRTLCSYTIDGGSKRNGDLISPTYPGVYPKNLSCSYKFIGLPGQRIRLEFRDFDIFYGGAHCPFDEVKVYDGMDPTASQIGTYCGQQRNLVVFSSAQHMLVTFTTLDRSTEAQNRGFKGVWEFSESFVKLDFIEKNMGTHIRGTECDQRILSKGQSSGVVYSPNYPFPYVPKIVCRYFIYGLQDPQHLERVRLSFEKFDVITSVSSEEDTTNQSEVKKCGDGFLKVYLKGQEVVQAYDKADYEFCGKEVPHDVVSDGPRLVLVFSSGEPVGSGFKARYQFETEYRVPGTAAPDGSCHFTYYSSSRIRGEFNSPRFPSNYPSMTNCTYIFFQQPNEQVRIVFDNFKMRSDKFNYTDRGAYGDYCEEDWVEVWNVINDADDRLVGRYCGTTAPGPIESRERASALKIILHTDDEDVYSGFKARYIYFNAKSIFGECGQNITQAQSGVLTSPKWPQKYDGPSKGEGSATCNWYLSVRPGSRVMLHFQNFAIEGEPYGRGCPAAAVRIWVDPDGVPVELCGESLMVENSQYVSARNLMRVTFITADKAVGAPGFRAVWTEVQEVQGAPCHHSYFRCEKSLFCIPGELRCDGVENCGTKDGISDNSDEVQCNGGLEFGDMNTLIAIVVGVLLFLVFIVLACAWGQRRKRRRRRRLQLRRPPIHVCDNALNNITSLTELPTTSAAAAANRHYANHHSIPHSHHSQDQRHHRLPPQRQQSMHEQEEYDEDHMDHEDHHHHPESPLDDDLPPPPPLDVDDESPLDDEDD